MDRVGKILIANPSMPDGNQRQKVRRTFARLELT